MVSGSPEAEQPDTISQNSNEIDLFYKPYAQDDLISLRRLSILFTSIQLASKTDHHNASLTGFDSSHNLVKHAKVVHVFSSTWT